MEFIPKHYKDKLNIINPKGFIGIVCLWSKQDFVIKKLSNFGVDLSENSKIAIIGNLYGNGISELLVNLLYNPQITNIIVCGSNLSGSKEEILSVFENGIEISESLGKKIYKIKGTQRSVNEAISQNHISYLPNIKTFGDLQEEKDCLCISDYISSLSKRENCCFERINVDLIKCKIDSFPCEPRSITIVRNNPISAWKELIFNLKRFGKIVHLRKGDRQELSNVKVVIEDFEISDLELEKYNFSRKDIDDYAKSLMVSELPVDQDYTYGNRIREYYSYDFLDNVSKKILKYPNDRDCYIAVWDSFKDMEAKDAPCLASLFFRVFEEKLTLTATFRTHNAIDAWLKNVLGLHRLQKYVSQKTGIPSGAITVISHSISIDTSRYDFAERISDSKKFEINIDYNGQILIEVENKEIIVRHTNFEGIEIGIYRSCKPERIQHELYRDCVISDINHAIYIGRMLEKAYNSILNNTEFIQE